jgi:hypothetical protein
MLQTNVYVPTKCVASANQQIYGGNNSNSLWTVFSTWLEESMNIWHSGHTVVCINFYNAQSAWPASHLGHLYPQSKCPVWTNSSWKEKTTTPAGNKSVTQPKK